MSKKSQVRATPERTAGVALAEFTAKRRGPLRRFFYHRPVVMDVAVVLAYWLITLPNIFWREPGDPWWPFVFSLIAGLALFFRRRFPLPVLISAGLIDVLLVIADNSRNSNAGFAVMFALYAVAVAKGGRFGFIAATAATLPIATLIFI